MGFTRLYPTKDTFVSSFSGSRLLNYGNDVVNELSVSSTSSSNEYTRILMQFDISSSLTANCTGNYSAVFTMFNCRNYKFADENFYIEIYPVTESWSEGKGTVLNPVSSAANYVDRTQGVNWSSSGGAFTASPSASVYFQNGTENLTANLSAFVEYWKANTNNGIIIKFPTAIESSSSTFNNNKSFYGRATNTYFKPFIDFTYITGLIQDDKRNLRIGANKFFIYDKNVSGTAYTGTAVMKADLFATGTTAYAINYFSPNTWYIDFTANTMAYEELYFIYSNTANNYSITSSVTGHQQSTSLATHNINYITGKLNIAKEYKQSESPIIWASINHYLNHRMGNYAVRYYPTNVHLYFIEKNTRAIAMPEQEMNYDENGYFLKVPMSNFQNGYWYIPVLKIVDYDGTIIKEIVENEIYVRQ